MKKDKLLHLIVGILIGIISLIVFESVVIAIFLSAVVGSLKELIDSKGYGTVEFADFLFTILGGVVGVVGWSIISHSI